MVTNSNINRGSRQSGCSVTTQHLAALALALLAGLAGCDFPDYSYSPWQDDLGVRANQGCPDEEDCSDAAPEGLRARSLSLAAPPFITALGGTQTFSLEHPDGESFDLGFTATSNDPSIEVVTSSPGQFTIRGAAVGGAAITLRDTATGEMYDRFPLYSKAIDRAFLSPFQGSGVGLSLGIPFVYAGVEVNFAATLFSPDYEDGFLGDIGEPMADEGLQIFVVDGSEALFTIRQGSSNDRVLSVAQTVGSGSIGFRTSAGEERSIELFTFDRIGEISTSTPQTITVDTPFTVCSVPFAEGDGVPVLGVPFSYQIAGPAEILTEDGRCVGVNVSGPAPVELTISGGGATTSVALTATE